MKKGREEEKGKEMQTRERDGRRGKESCTYIMNVSAENLIEHTKLTQKRKALRTRERANRRVREKKVEERTNAGNTNGTRLKKSVNT